MPAKIIIEVSRSDDDGEEDGSEETSDDASDAVMAEDGPPEISEPEIRDLESDEPEMVADDAKGDEKKPQRSGWWRK